MYEEKIFLITTMLLLTISAMGCGMSIPEPAEEYLYTTEQLNTETVYTVLDVRESFATRDLYSYYTVSVILTDDVNNRYYISYCTMASNTNRNNKDNTYIELAKLVSGDKVKAGNGKYILILQPIIKN